MSFINKLFGVDTDGNEMIVSSDDGQYREVAKLLTDKAGSVSKGYNGKDTAIVSPQVLDDYALSTSNGYFPKDFDTKFQDVHQIIRAHSNDSLLNAIITTRINQATNFARRAEDTIDGTGFKVRLRNNAKPTPEQLATIRRAEKYIENMGVDYQPTRDNFIKFLRSFLRDSLIYDQANIENTYDSSMHLIHTHLVDPTSIYYLTDEHMHRPQYGKLYAQVFNNKIVRKFDNREMGMFIRNPRTDINSYGYGLSEVEVAMREIEAFENTESFNDRFFSQGGTTRGIINIQTDDSASRVPLDQFKREWRMTMGGIRGAFRIPVITAKDVKFVNLTPDANDMQFEKYLNFLINILCSLYNIDGAEIGFTNRGGATGNKSNSLNEGNNSSKIEASQNKGLRPLLLMVSDFITKHILKYLVGDNYIFEFVGGDLDSKAKQINIEKEESSYKLTVNEIRQKDGKKPLPGGDIPLSSEYINRLGQLMQKQQMEFNQRSQRLSQLQTLIGPGAGTSVGSSTLPGGISYQDAQAGFKGKPAKPSGKRKEVKTGKDGQLTSETNMNSSVTSAKKR